MAVGSDHAQAWLSVLDDGPGIPASERGRMLERFQRLDETGVVGFEGPTFRESPTGSGLGLAIITEIAHSHAGQIKLSDAPEGTGLLVTIRLPLAPARE